MKDSNARATARSGTGTTTAAAAWTVAGCVALSIVGAFLGSGALGGTPIKDAAGGWLSADGTPLAPGTAAFGIWSVIYAGLIGYAVLQLLPAARASRRHARLRPWAAASTLLNAAWIWSVQFGWLAASVVVIIVLLAVLGRILALLRASEGRGVVDAVLVDGTFGLYLGWVAVATVANVSAWLGSLGFTGFGWPNALLAAIVLAVAAAVGVGVSAYSDGRLAPAAALAWGLAWICVGRLDGGLLSVPIAWSAGLAAAVVVLAALVLRAAAERRAAVRA